ncbi:uncharacterized protein LOC143012139 [Genypterus blacodes]|uniref:uncharacterized protein LOC143012139 n=1 Tax=Genypterus blacodes TaxID=154954 RepID=UPI003F76A6CF
MDFISDVTAVVDEVYYKDTGRLCSILGDYSPKKNRSSYEVRGSFEEIEECFLRLSAVRSESGRSSQPDEKAAARVEPVEVACFVMTYIREKCSKELNRIQGENFVIEMQNLSSHSGNVMVSFTPQHAKAKHVHSQFIRQRFVTFYQRLAADMQRRSIILTLHNYIDLQQKFPQLLFEPRHNPSKAYVTGPFIQVAALEEFLLYKSSKNSPRQKDPTHKTATSVSHSTPPEDESCPICIEVIAATEKEILKCKHSFCKGCLKKAFEYKPVCPTCGALYGTLMGTQPEGGTMKVTKSLSSLPGYEQYGTIMIHYYIPNGIQKKEHPNPRQHYEGVSRSAYLPDSSEGRKVLDLLTRAFDQRLIFTVGRSNTTGRNNLVTWNDIHHKTSTHGGPTNFGYPDSEYLGRVQLELKSKGIH